MMFAAFALVAGMAGEESDFYAVDYLTPPVGEVIEVGGMAFLDSNTLLVSTRRGRVWWIDNALAEDPADAKFHIFAEGLHEGLGLAVNEGQIYVVQRGELSRLIDLDGDHICDRIETVSQDWGMSGNYHEFAFGLPIDAQGNFFVSTNLGFWSPEWWHGVSKMDERGWILRIAPDGEATPWAMGVRSPAGLGIDSEQRLLYSDNQGDWMPTCGLFHVQKDEFYGHPASLRWTEPYGFGEQAPSSIDPPDMPRTGPAIWLPYEWSKSTGNFVPDETGGKFGPFDNQLFVAELTEGMVLRALLEEVNGKVQGAVIPFRKEIGSVLRVQFAPDGTLFCGMTNRGWGGLAPASGIARVRWNGVTPTEYQSIHLLEDGFHVRFSAPLSSVPTAEQFKIYDYDYNWWWDYGSPKTNIRDMAISAVKMDADGLGMTVSLADLQAGKCVRVKLEGAGLLHDEFDYTIHRLPEGPAEDVFVAKRVAPPEQTEAGDGGWLALSWQDPFGTFSGEGWKLVDAALDPADRSGFVTTPGNGALVNGEGAYTDFLSRLEFGDIEFSFAFMLPEGGDSGLYLMDRYELQLNDDATSCLGVVGGKGPRAKAYKGAGEWHKVKGKFFAPRFDDQGKKTANARFEEITMDGVMVLGSAECEGPTGGAVSTEEVALGPMRFQGTISRVALGDMRVKPMRESRLPEGDWQNLEEVAFVTGSFEMYARLSLSDAGASLIEFDGSDPGDDGFQLILNHTGSGALRTGSLKPGNTLSTQHCFPGVPFDVRMQRDYDAGKARIRVWLNDVLVNDTLQSGVGELGSIQWIPVAVPNTEVQVEHVVVRSL
ncbi:MAG: glucose/arabinose dehydrogenase [Planctomycetota bacterium]|jgi:glucose/arabinose dehydrogenase